jgi:hypothetical protein
MNRMPCFRLVFGAVLLAAVPSARAAELDRYVPADAQFVLHVNARQLLDAPLTRKFALEHMRATLQKQPGLQEALDALGIDLFQDVRTVTVALAEHDGSLTGLMIVRGRLDRARIDTAAEQFARDHPDALKIHRPGGTAIYEVIDRAEKGKPAFAAVLEREVVVVAPTQQAVVDAIACRDGKKTAGPVKELRDLVSRLDGRQTAWLAGVLTDDLRKRLAGGVLGKDRAGEIKAVSGGLTVTDALQAALHIETTSRHTASDVRKMLAGLKSLAAYAMAHNENAAAHGPFVSAVLRATRITSDAGGVTIRVNIRPNQLEKEVRTGPKE